MARTYSTMMPLGTQAPSFELPDAQDGKTKSLSEIRGDSGTLVMFICNHCPFVKHLQKALGELSSFVDKGLGIAAISANDIANYPQDAPQHMATFARENSFGFPYLFDESQSVAKAYQATCTPDFFLFDKELRCVYRGRYDASSPGNGVAITGEDLLAAIDAVLSGGTPAAEQHPSLGCNIKWK